MKNKTTRKAHRHPKRFPAPSLGERLFEPVDIASIAVFRMMFGAIICWEVWRYFSYGWIDGFYIDPKFYFKYLGFEWIHPWSGDGMHIHFVAIAVCALCVLAGFLYRIMSWLLFLCLAYWFLLDQSHYLNHVYLIILLALLMAVIPAHRAKSLDAHWRPNIASDTVPAWCLWILRVQVGIVYVYGGIAKLNGDWLRGNPPRQWLADRADFPLVGSLLDTEAAVWIMSYGGLIFDLAVVPALLWPKTRAWAFAACIGFHITNAWLFSIGIFPIMMLAGTLLMLPPDWPRKAVFFFAPLRRDSAPKAQPSAPLSDSCKRLTSTFLAIYLAIQLLVPFRHFLYPGSVHWTAEGHRFAWHMKLSSTRASFRFLAVDPIAKTAWVVDHLEYLTPSQSFTMGGMPDMCLQFAHFLADDLEKKGHLGIEIHMQNEAMLNGRDYQVLIDESVDLSKEPRNLWHADWITPQQKPGAESSK